MSHLSKALVIGLLTAMVGLGVSLLNFGLDLEENIGLDLLFRVRGTRQAPREVVVVSIDKESAQHFNLPNDPRKWPRSYHARLIESLIKQRAAVIAFDIIFDETKSAEDDQRFAEAIRKANNVVLCEYIKREQIPFSGKGGSQAGSLNIEKLVTPIPPLAKAAVALAPFPLPKIPIRVNQYWTFKTEAGDTPTLPVVAFQVYAMEVYDEFIHLLRKVSPSQAERLPRDKKVIITSRSIENVIGQIRSLFENDPLLGENMLKELENSRIRSVGLKETQILKSLIKMYQSTKSRFLNFYGPPGTIVTISYHQLLEHQEEAAFKQKQFDFRGKAVFIGLSERSLSEQKDGFYTVFSESSGLDLSGVEIAATAFANLIQEKSVQPIGSWAHLIVLFLWGVVIGIVCYCLPTLIAAGATIGLGVVYFAFSEYQFKTMGIWYPLALPLLIQPPLAFFSAVLWKTIVANRERESIRKALRYHLPDRAVDQLAKSIGDFKASQQRVYGICLYTDAEQYTSLSEAMDPEELSPFMNRYFEILFKPVKEQGGIVSDIAGDSILALWVTERPNLASRRQACQAALSIAKAVEEFNRSSGSIEEGNYEVDLAGNLTFFNNALVRFSGYPEEELTGMNHRRLITDEAAKKVFQVFGEVYQTGKPANPFDSEMIRKDGTKRFIETSVSLIQDSKGRPAGFRVIARRRFKLPTRIGLHSGNIMLGDIGAIDHYEYRPVGDIVNTSNRIENLNKYLGTQVLVSEDVIGQLDAFLTRDLGRFLLAGKKKPLGIHELVCRVEESDERQRELCAMFSSILGTFRGRSWAEAEKRLQQTIERFGKDGPSLYYLDLCKKYRQTPPDESWDGVVPVAEK